MRRPAMLVSCHRCDDQYYSWGWLPGACFHPGRSAVLHTKKFPEPDPGGEDAQCPAGERCCAAMPQLDIERHMCSTTIQSATRCAAACPVYA